MEVPIQAAIGGRVLARQTVMAKQSESYDWLDDPFDEKKTAAERERARMGGGAKAGVGCGCLVAIVLVLVCIVLALAGFAGVA